MSVGGGEAVARPSNKTIDQLDGITEPAKEDSIGEVDKKDDETIESTVTFDLTISAVTFLDAFASIDENLSIDEYGDKIPFISEVPSREERDETNKGNTLYTLEIRVVNEKTFLEQLEKKFHNWVPLWNGQPRGVLLKFLKRKITS